MCVCPRLIGIGYGSCGLGAVDWIVENEIVVSDECKCYFRSHCAMVLNYL